LNILFNKKNKEEEKTKIQKEGNNIIFLRTKAIWSTFLEEKKIICLDTDLISQRLNKKKRKKKKIKNLTLAFLHLLVETNKHYSNYFNSM
jgi:hypothetical protein